CATPEVVKCFNMIGSLTTEDFEGYPTHEQINTACPKMNQFKTCIAPFKANCDAINTDQAKQISKAIEATLGLVDLMCGSEFKAGFMKHGMECFDKESFKNATKANCDSMKAPKPEPGTTGSAEPEPESKAQECHVDVSIIKASKHKSVFNVSYALLESKIYKETSSSDDVAGLLLRKMAVKR
ncbi:Hypothetical predicted protein, partial [Mytilus galloprovincialis]